MKFKAFTLAEGATHVDISSNIRRVAFTLAEVLITLAIIGIVAAMTIPTLVANYQRKAWNTSAQVFERKLEEALRQMNTQQVLAGYKSTADFVGALGKYFKINKVCQNDDIMSCFEDKVYWGKNELAVSTENVKTAAQLGQYDWNTETIGVQFANGTTGILAYNPDCRENPFSNQFSGTSCLALLYDTTGFKTPNVDGKDLRYINVTEIDGHKPCAVEINGICLTAPFYPEPISRAECEALKEDLNITGCYYDNDYWAGAVKACGGKGNMLTPQQMHNITVKELIDLGLECKENKAYVWDNMEYKSGYSKWGWYSAFGCSHNYVYMSGHIKDRNDGSLQAFCISN